MRIYGISMRILVVLLIQIVWLYPIESSGETWHTNSEIKLNERIMSYTVRYGQVWCVLANGDFVVVDDNGSITVQIPANLSDDQAALFLPHANKVVAIKNKYPGETVIDRIGSLFADGSQLDIWDASTRVKEQTVEFEGWATFSIDINRTRQLLVFETVVDGRPRIALADINTGKVKSLKNCCLGLVGLALEDTVLFALCETKLDILNVSLHDGIVRQETHLFDANFSSYLVWNGLRESTVRLDVYNGKLDSTIGPIEFIKRDGTFQYVDELFYGPIDPDKYTSHSVADEMLAIVDTKAEKLTLVDFGNQTIDHLDIGVLITDCQRSRILLVSKNRFVMAPCNGGKLGNTLRLIEYR